MTEDRLLAGDGGWEAKGGDRATGSGAPYSLGKEALCPTACS